MSLVDLPGYGYAKVPGAIKDHWVKTLPRYLQERNSLAGLIIVMDIRRPLTNSRYSNARLVCSKTKTNSHFAYKI